MKNLRALLNGLRLGEHTLISVKFLIHDLHLRGEITRKQMLEAIAKLDPGILSKKRKRPGPP